MDKDHIISAYKDADYWQKTKPRVMGDIEQRPKAVELFSDITGKKILDAGCGTGYVARMLANAGAQTEGCDISNEMLDLAKKSELSEPLNIMYKIEDILNLKQYENESFDGILSVGVMIHHPIENWEKFITASKRVLKKGGVLVISVEHPFLFTPMSPTRQKKQCWAIHTPLNPQIQYEQSQEFKEEYFDINGNVFTSTLWHHTVTTMMKAVLSSGLIVEVVRELFIKKEHLVCPFWGKDYDYPGFLQFRLVKKA